MTTTDPVVQDMMRIQRIVHDFTEPPIVNGKPLSVDDMNRLTQFICTIATNMADSQVLQKPWTEDELAKMMMAVSKWSLEEMTR